MKNINIDPIRLGNLEFAWWKAHHEHDIPKVLTYLTEQNMAMYGFNREEAQDALKYLIEAVKFHDTREWNRAIESITKYFQKIKDKTGLRFDPQEVATLEIGWWRLHDELEHNPDKSALVNAFASVYATQFGVNKERLKKAAELKTEATREHDLAEDPNRPPQEVEQHWEKTNTLLIDFYAELKKVVD